MTPRKSPTNRAFLGVWGQIKFESPIMTPYFSDFSKPAKPVRTADRCDLGCLDNAQMGASLYPAFNCCLFFVLKSYYSPILVALIQLPILKSCRSPHAPHIVPILAIQIGAILSPAAPTNRSQRRTGGYQVCFVLVGVFFRSCALIFSF